MSTSVFNLWYNHASSSAGMRPRIGHSTVVRQNRAVCHVNSRGHAKAWESITPTQGPTPKCGSQW